MGEEKLLFIPGTGCSSCILFSHGFIASEFHPGVGLKVFKGMRWLGLISWHRAGLPDSEICVIPWGSTASSPVARRESLENHGMVWVGGDLPNLVPAFHLPFSFLSVIQRIALTPTAETGKNRPSSSSAAFISPPFPGAAWEQPHSRAGIPVVAAACAYVK